METKPKDAHRWPKGMFEYERVLEGKTLVPGVGIAGTLTFEHTIADQYALIGGGEEDMNQPFVYFFTKGAFALAIAGRFSRAQQQMIIVRIRYCS